MTDLVGVGAPEGVGLDTTGSTLNSTTNTGINNDVTKNGKASVTQRMIVKTKTAQHL